MKNGKHKLCRTYNCELRTLLEGVVYIEESEMVTVNVGKSHLRVVGCLFRLIRSDETLWD